MRGGVSTEAHVIRWAAARLALARGHGVNAADILDVKLNVQIDGSCECCGTFVDVAVDAYFATSSQQGPWSFQLDSETDLVALVTEIMNS